MARKATAVPQKRRPASAIDRLQQTLEGIAPRRSWRLALALLSGFFTFAATTGGLFIVVPWLFTSAVAGIAVGLVAPDRRSSALIGAITALAGATLGPKNVYAGYFASGLDYDALSVILAIVVCAAAAAGTAFLRGRHHRAGTLLVSLALAILVANLWYTTLAMNAAPLVPQAAGTSVPSFNDELAQRVPPARPDSDGVLFFDVYRTMVEGKGFYEAYSQVIARRGGTGSVADFRVPLVFWLWATMPNAQGVVILFLVLASIAAASVVALSSASVKMPLALPGAAALTSYLAVFPTNTMLFQQDVWAGIFGVLALALYAMSLRRHNWRAWTCLCVAMTVLTVLTRETAGFFLVSGFASAFFSERDQRKFRVGAWTLGGLGFTVLYGVHFLMARPFITPTGGVPRAGAGGLGFMLRGLTHATVFLGQNGWLPIVLATAGIAGALLLRDRDLRVFAALTIGATVISFLFLGNYTTGYGANGEIVVMNYWGEVIIPLLYALVPSALLIVPGAGNAARQTLRPPQSNSGRRPTKSSSMTSGNVGSQAM